MRKVLRKTLSLVLTVLALVVMGLYLSSHWQDVRALLSASPQWSIPVLALMVLRLVIRSQAMVSALAAIGKPVTLSDSVAVSAVANGLNQFLPLQGGLAFRAVFFRRRYSIQYSQFSGTFLAVQLLTICFTSFVALIGCFFLPPSSTVYVAMAAAAVVFVALSSLFLILPLPKRPKRIAAFLKQAHDGFTGVRRDRRSLLHVIVCVALLRLVDGLSFWCACQSIGVTLSFWNAIFVTSIVGMVNLVQITPNNLGIVEALYAVVASSFSLSPVECLTAGLIVRMAMVIRSMISLLPAMAWLNSRSKSIEEAPC